MNAAFFDMVDQHRAAVRQVHILEVDADGPIARDNTWSPVVGGATGRDGGGARRWRLRCRSPSD